MKGNDTSQNVIYLHQEEAARLRTATAAFSEAVSCAMDAVAAAAADFYLASGMTPQEARQAIEAIRDQQNQERRGLTP